MARQGRHRWAIETVGLLTTIFTGPSAAAETNLLAGSSAATSRRLQTFGVTSLGCFVDSRSDRVLDLALLDSGAMTPDFCAATCLTQGETLTTGSYSYFAVQYGEECWCGLEGVDYARLGVATNCDRACTGDSSIDCGGRNAFEIFEYELVGIESLGCWADFKDDRLFGTPHTKSSTNTPEECQASCSDGGFEYFGVQYAEECFCGVATEDYTRHGASSACTYGCAGDDAIDCGGRNAMEVCSWRRPPPRPCPCRAPGVPRLLGRRYGPRVLCSFQQKRRKYARDDGCNLTFFTSCQATCSGYEYFGLQYGEECFCGAADEDYTAYGASTGCMSTCTGDYHLSTCGGRYAMDVYSVSDHVPATPSARAVIPSPTPALPPRTPAPVFATSIGGSANGCMVVFIEAEDLDLVGDWNIKSDPAASGGEYIVWEGLGNNESNNQSTDDIITTTVQIANPGTYRFKWKMRQPDGVESDKANDTWLYFPNAARFGPVNSDASYGGFVKVYGRALNGVFEYSGTAEEPDNDKTQIAIEFAQAGEYTMEIAGRSHGHEIDQIVLFDEGVEVDDIDIVAAGC